MAGKNQSARESGEAVPPRDYKISIDPFIGEPPIKYKYIWLSFRNLNDDQQNLAPDIVKFNSEWDHDSQLSNRYVEEFNTPPHNYDANTYAQWLTIFPEAENLPRFWSFSWSKNHSQYNANRGNRVRVEDSGSGEKARERERDRNGGGYRRSLQKSRFLKRKSRKYKSIKKSKKRSFRNRGRH